MYKNKNNPAFTIVELLIVIVIIGILAAITIVSYTGITKKANESSIQADLANAKKQIELYKVIHGQYPTGLDPNNCLTGNIAPSPDTNYCLKKSNSTATYTMSNADGSIYTLKLDNGTLAYKITESTGPTSIAATPIAESFVKTWGGSGIDVGRGIAQTGDGGFVVTGYTASFGAGNDDVLLAKYDANGNLIWNKLWGGSGIDMGTSVVVASDGGYVVTGYTASYGAGSDDVIINKYDANGNILWSKTWGGAGSDDANSIIIASDGNYLIAANTTSYGAGSFDALMLKYDLSGNLIWSKTWGGASMDVANSISSAPDGGYMIAGYTASYSAGSFDAYVAKYDISGTLSWNKTWGGTGDDEGTALVSTTDGGCVTTGFTISYAAGGSWDAFVNKYDSSGNLSWSRTWGGSDLESGSSIIRSSDGGYVLTGQTNSFGYTGANVFVIKYDSSGNLIWNKIWGGVGSESPIPVIAFNGGYIVTGNTTSYGAGSNDVFISKFNSTGDIISCASPACQTPSATIATPSATITTPSATITSPSATVASPSATITTPTATQTTVVAAP